MNETEFRKLSAYYAMARSVKTQIENLEKLIGGIERRAKSGCNLFRVNIFRERDRPMDTGIYVTIPEYVFREAIVPALRKSLVQLKAEYKALPSVECAKYTDGV